MSKENLFIITEYMDQGSLRDLLRVKGHELDWTVRVKMAIDIAQGLNYLHSFKPKVLHRDLKSSNILADKAYNFKIADFGVARFRFPPASNFFF